MCSNWNKIIGTAVIILLLASFAKAPDYGACASGLNAQTENGLLPPETAPPLDGVLKYPFTKDDSRRCGHWRPGSQDYPYFGAPRDGNTRRHAGIDLYPATGAGTPVMAIREGRVIKSAPFYRRRNGEVTYALLIDHGKFVANYAELKKTALAAGAIVRRRQIIGFVSGTQQLHFELYKPGTGHWTSWRGKMPPQLIDPTDMMTRAFKNPVGNAG